MVIWLQDQQYYGESESGHFITLDGDAAHRAGRVRWNWC